MSPDEQPKVELAMLTMLLTQVVWENISKKRGISTAQEELTPQPGRPVGTWATTMLAPRAKREIVVFILSAVELWRKILD
jgi:hypothetical protein